MSDSDSVCAMNIGPRERQKRLIAGIVFCLLTIGLGYFLISSGVQRVYRLMLFPAIFISSLCLLQVKHKTCVALAMQDQQNLDSGNQKIQDDELRKAIWTNTLKIFIWTFVF